MSRKNILPFTDIWNGRFHYSPEASPVRCQVLSEVDEKGNVDIRIEGEVEVISVIASDVKVKGESGRAKALVRSNAAAIKKSRNQAAKRLKERNEVFEIEVDLKMSENLERLRSKCSFRKMLDSGNDLGYIGIAYKDAIKSVEYVELRANIEISIKDRSAALIKSQLYNTFNSIPSEAIGGSHLLANVLEDALVSRNPFMMPRENKAENDTLGHTYVDGERIVRVRDVVSEFMRDSAVKSCITTREDVTEVTTFVVRVLQDLFGIKFYEVPRWYFGRNLKNPEKDIGIVRENCIVVKPGPAWDGLTANSWIRTRPKVYRGPFRPPRVSTAPCELYQGKMIHTDDKWALGITPASAPAVYKTINKMSSRLMEVDKDFLAICARMYGLEDGFAQDESFKRAIHKPVVSVAGLEEAQNFEFYEGDGELDEEQLARERMMMGRLMKYEGNQARAAAAMKSKSDQILRILDWALINSNSPFFFDYYLDFRGRLYNECTGATEQSIDVGKALIQTIPQRLGPDGKEALYYHLASLCAFEKVDKLPWEQRVHWARNHFQIFYTWGMNPYSTQKCDVYSNKYNWRDADSPFQFLKACIELYKLVQWERAGNKTEDFKTTLYGFLDGSNNGLQHLTALTRDDTAYSHVNLNKWDGKAGVGDAYLAVANVAFKGILDHNVDAALLNSMSNTSRIRRAILNANKRILKAVDMASVTWDEDLLFPDLIQEYLFKNVFIEEGLCSIGDFGSFYQKFELAAVRISGKSYKSPAEKRRSIRKILAAVLNRIANEYSISGEERLNHFCSVWQKLQLLDPQKLKPNSSFTRKAFKRPVMVMPYGGTARGMAEQFKQDSMDFGWEALLQYSTQDSSFATQFGMTAKSTSEMVFPRAASLQRTWAELGASRDTKVKAIIKANSPKNENGEVIGPYRQTPESLDAIDDLMIKWVGPTGFRVSHAYWSDSLQRITIDRHTSKRMEIRVASPLEAERVMYNTKQGSSLAPNSTHHLDAAHLCMIVASAPYDCMTIHDSFGAHLSNLKHLYHHTRQQFAALYQDKDYIHSLLEQQFEGEESVPDVDMGDFDINEVLSNPYAFA